LKMVGFPRAGKSKRRAAAESSLLHTARPVDREKAKRAWGG